MSSTTPPTPAPEFLTIELINHEWWETVDDAAVAYRRHGNLDRYRAAVVAADERKSARLDEFAAQGVKS